MSKFIFEHKVGEKFLFKGIDCKVGFVNQGKAWLSPLKDDPALGLVQGLSFAVIDEHREDKDGNIAISHNMLDKIIEKLACRYIETRTNSHGCGAA